MQLTVHSYGFASGFNWIVYSVEIEPKPLNSKGNFSFMRAVSSGTECNIATNSPFALRHLKVVCSEKMT